MVIRALRRRFDEALTHGDVDDDPTPLLDRDERPTIPVPAPRESGVRLHLDRVAGGAATVDVVVCDLTRDPRSEDFLLVRRERAPMLRSACGRSARR